MTAPLVVLAGFAVLLGAPVLPSSYGVKRWLDTPAGTLPLHVGAVGVLVTTLISLAAVAVVVVLWRRRPAADPVDMLGRLATPLRRAFFIDDLYGAAVVRPVGVLARITLGVDRRGIDATAVGGGRAAVLLGTGLRRLQTGNLQTYLSALMAGMLIVVLSVSVAVAT
jgi:NADH-quinone oxidoreductase subunit L